MSLSQRSISRKPDPRQEKIHFTRGYQRGLEQWEMWVQTGKDRCKPMLNIMHFVLSGIKEVILTDFNRGLTKYDLK